MKKLILYGIPVFIALALLIQLIPYGRDHVNPMVNVEPNWDSPRTRTLAQRACFDCHSNQTIWPWYSNVAPVSWLIYHDVIGGREHINFSDWNRAKPQQVNEFQKVYNENSMPPANYLLLHPSARLTAAERKELFAGLAVLANNYGH